MMIEVYLADGRNVTATVTDCSADGSGWICYENQRLPVKELAVPFQGVGYGQVVALTLADGRIWDAVFQPAEYTGGVALVELDADTHVITCLRDPRTGQWREMTDEEYERERRAWDADQSDLQQIRQEWDKYRREGLGERG